MPAPKTGKLVSSKTETTATAQLTKSSAIVEIPLTRARTRVAKKVTAPASELRPKRCRLKIAIEIASDDEKSIPVRGKYKVHPAEIPASNANADKKSCTARTLTQKAREFSLGVAKSSWPNELGTTKLPKPEINPGMMNKKSSPIREP